MTLTLLLYTRDTSRCESSTEGEKRAAVANAELPPRSGANLTVPYYGLAAPLKGLQSKFLRFKGFDGTSLIFLRPSVLDDTSDVLGVDLPTLIGADGERPRPYSSLVELWNLLLVLSTDNIIPKSTINTTVSLSSKSSAIQVVFRLATGTRFFVVDVVKASNTLHPTFDKRSILYHSDVRLRKAVKKGLLPFVDGLVGGVVKVASNLTSSLLEDLSVSSKRAMFGSLGTLQSQDYACECQLGRALFPSAELNLLPPLSHLIPTLDRSAEDNPADYYYISFNGTVTPTSGGNLTAKNLEPGSYKLLLRALKLTGDLTIEGDYESEFWFCIGGEDETTSLAYRSRSPAWLSPPIQLVK